MKEYTKTEFAVGAFVIAGLTAIGFLSVSVGGLKVFQEPRTMLSARFSSVGQLKKGAQIKMAGVSVGTVKKIELVDFVADATLAIKPSVPIPADTIASIRTAGLLGESYILLRPGGSEEDLKSGGRISQTEPAIDLIDLVVKYALGSGGDEGDAAADDKPAATGGSEDEDDDIPDPF